MPRRKTKRRAIRRRVKRTKPRTVRKSTLAKRKKKMDEFLAKHAKYAKQTKATLKYGLAKRKGYRRVGREHQVIVRNWDIKRDEKRKAKRPGRRVSASGKVYYEYRSNRSDIGRV